MAGRPIPEFIQRNFVQKEKVENSSNRWYYTCLHCQKGIEHHDNRLLSHIKNPMECRKATPEIRRQANTLLAAKANANLEIKILDDAESQTLKKRKSWQGSPLESFLERELSPNVVNDLSLKCLWYVILVLLYISK